MYKLASRNLQRAHRVTAPVPAPNCYVESDFIPSADNLSREECENERKQILTDLARVANELVAARNAANSQRIAALGGQKQVYQSRMSALNARLKALNIEASRQANMDALKQAVLEICDAEMAQRILQRRSEIMEAAA